MAGEEFNSNNVLVVRTKAGRMVGANGGPDGHRAHLLLVYSGLAGHYYPFHQLLYLLSSPRYVNKVVVTAVSSESRVEELAKLKERGDFGGLGLRTEVLPRSASANSEFARIMKEKPGPEYVIRLAEIAFESIKKKLVLETDDAPTCIVSDMFYTFLTEVAKEWNVPWYPLVPAAAWYTYSCFLGSDPRFNSTDPEVRKGKIPGLEFSRVFDYPPDILNYPEFYATTCERYARCKAILINEPEEWDAPAGAVTALRDYFQKKAVTQNKQYEDIENPECFTWLDKQPAKSVLYVAFGTLMNITDNALLELAHGLEDSGVSFLWVYKIGASQSLASFLPAGFQDRTRGRGLIEFGFVPQSRILQHPAVGGFLSHCGWNSSMESICAGVPLITWPLSLDQPLNARFVVNVWKAGVGIKKPDEDYKSHVSREEVTKAVKTLMIGEEGEEVRKNVQVLKSLAETAVKEGGSSYTALHSFLEELLTSPPKM